MQLHRGQTHSLKARISAAAGMSAKPRPDSKDARLHTYSPDEAFMDLEAVLQRFTKASLALVVVISGGGEGGRQTVADICIRMVQT